VGELVVGLAFYANQPHLGLANEKWPFPLTESGDFWWRIE